MTPGEALGHARAALGQATSGSTRSIGTGEALEVGQVLEAALQALADVRTLELWEDGDTGRKVELFNMVGAAPLPWCCACEGIEPGSAYRRTFRGDSRDEARAKAAAWVRGLR